MVDEGCGRSSSLSKNFGRFIRGIVSRGRIDLCEGGESEEGLPPGFRAAITAARIGHGFVQTLAEAGEVGRRGAGDAIVEIL